MNKLGKLLIGGTILVGVGIFVSKRINSKEDEEVEAIENELIDIIDEDEEDVAFEFDEVIDHLNKNTEELDELLNDINENNIHLDKKLKQTADMLRDLTRDDLTDKPTENVVK